MAETALGIDVGGSGIKGAVVDLKKGDFDGDRLRIDTPKKSTPENVADVIKQIVDSFADRIKPTTPVGVTVPAPVLHGLVPRIANLDKSWKGCEAEKLLEAKLGRKVYLVNDADAAGVAEDRFGAAKGFEGFVLMTTLGTGIGSAIIYNGVLVPNAELGHLEIDGHDAETRAAASVREKEGWSYDEWVPRLQRYYEVVYDLLYPDLIVVGGGVSRKADKFLPKLKLPCKIIPAKLENRAGIIGAAWLAKNAK